MAKGMALTVFHLFFVVGLPSHDRVVNILLCYIPSNLAEPLDIMAECPSLGKRLVIICHIYRLKNGFQIQSTLQKADCKYIKINFKVYKTLEFE